MIEKFDFSNAKIRCHALYYVVAEGATRTPKQKYEYFQSILLEEKQKYGDMDDRRQGMPNGLKKAAKIAGLEYELQQLESKKHIDPLPRGARTYLKKLYGELKYGKVTSFKDKGNKFTNKGQFVEEESLKLISRLDGFEYKKNEVRIENDFISGVPDTFKGDNIYKAEYIPDVKSSWDWDSFSENIGCELNPVYWWQQQGYFALTGAMSGEVSYCLISLPHHLLMAEIDNLRNRMSRQMNVIDVTVTQEYRLAEAQLINNLTFDEIPPEERRLKFEVKRNEEVIQKIYNTIPRCREYLMEVQEMHLNGFFSDKELPILDTIDEI